MADESAVGEELPREAETVQVGQSTYLPALDGLRFFAFFLVFCHHFPTPLFPVVFPEVSSRGWIGVEIFFAISSYLFFRLFIEEERRAGSIDVPRFYLRRLLRLYPLMVAFPVAMAIIDGRFDPLGIARVIGMAAFVDNFMCWVASYSDVAYTGHLWTLSYEFQIYLVIPLAFLLFRSIGLGRFLIVIGLVYLACLAARGAFVLVDARHPIIWVTPFLRPESTLLGIVLSLGLLARLPVALVGGLTILATVALFAGPNVNQIGPWTMALYPVAAIIACGLIWLVNDRRILAWLFESRILVFLGKISFGLYVYHYMAILLIETQLRDMPTGLRFALALVFTIVLAIASYYLLERPFLRLKRRFTVVHGRPA